MKHEPAITGNAHWMVADKSHITKSGNDELGLILNEFGRFLHHTVKHEEEKCVLERVTGSHVRSICLGFDGNLLAPKILAPAMPSLGWSSDVA